MAEALVRAGADVILVARREAQLRAAVEELEPFGRVAYVVADLADRADCARAAQQIGQPFGEPDILLNSAGVNIRPPLADLSEADWDRTLALNLTAPHLLGQRFGPSMAERGWGRIINVTSLQAHMAFGNSGGYGASKGGLAALTRSQAEAWSPLGVCCNAVAPGVVRTPMNDPVFGDPARAAALADRTTVGRNGEAADFAGVAVFLASAASDFLTGQTITIDGGFSTH